MPMPTTTWATSSASRASSIRPPHAYEQAIALRPDFAEAANNLGSVLWRQDKLDEAAADSSRPSPCGPTYAEAHYNLGNVLAQQGKFDQAVARFRAGRGSPARLCRGPQQPGQRPCTS